MAVSPRTTPFHSGIGHIQCTDYQTRYQGWDPQQESSL